MQFKFNVLPTKQQDGGAIGFLFVPTDMQVIVGDKSTLSDGTEIVSVQTTLRQIIEGGYIEQVRDQQLPITILQAINGWDAMLMQPAIDNIKLNEILAQFNLKIS